VKYVPHSKLLEDPETMPTYVYACDACGNQFELVQSFKDEPLRICPCGKEGSVRRVFQPVGIVFKGSGWYITDSRKSENAAPKSTKDSGSEPAAKESSGEAAAKPEATPSTPTESKSSSESTTSTPATTPATPPAN
jgi:putative FmdB family regulatory protein